MGVFKKIAKFVLVGVGTVLSIIPAVGPIVGGALISAGAAMDDKASSVDPVSNSAAMLGQALSNAGAYGTVASGGSVVNTNSIFTWIKANLVLILGVIAAIIFLPKLLRRRR